MSEDFISQFTEIVEEELRQKMAEADEAFERRDYTMASFLYAEILEDYPDNLDALLRQGICFRKQRNARNAINYFDKLLALADSTGDIKLKKKVKEAALLNKANCFLDMKELEASLALYNRVLRINPAQWRAMLGKSNVYKEKLEIRLANEWLRKAERTRKRYLEG